MFTSQNGLWSINSGKELFTDENIKSICEKSIRYKIPSSLDLASLKIYEKDKNGNYWLTNKNQVILTKINGNKLADNDAVKTISISINGGTIGLFDRIDNVKKLKEVF